MNRKEFCDKLIECRKDSQSKMKDICFYMDVMPNNVYRLEKGTHSFSIDNALMYLKVIGYGLFLKNGRSKEFHFDNRENFGIFFKKVRKKSGLSLKKLAKQVSADVATIVNIELAKHNTTIDNLLKCLDVLECEITIKKLKNNE